MAAKPPATKPAAPRPPMPTTNKPPIGSSQGPIRGMPLHQHTPSTGYSPRCAGPDAPCCCRTTRKCESSRSRPPDRATPRPNRRCPRTIPAATRQVPAVVRRCARPVPPGGEPPPLGKAEPGKPIYERKPASRARPTMDRRFEEGERKLHPVRARPGMGERRPARAEAPPPVERPPREITMTEGVTVRDLAEKLDVRAKDLLKVLLDHGVFASINQALDTATATSLGRSVQRHRQGRHLRGRGRSGSCQGRKEPKILCRARRSSP